MSPAASREYHAFSAPRRRRSSMWTEMLHPQLWICVRMSIAAKFVVQDQSRLFLDLFVFHSLIYQKNHHFLYVSFLAPSRGSFVVCEYLWYDSLIALWLSSIIRYVNRSCILGSVSGSIWNHRCQTSENIYHQHLLVFHFSLELVQVLWNSYW